MGGRRGGPRARAGLHLGIPAHSCRRLRDHARKWIGERRPSVTISTFHSTRSPSRWSRTGGSCCMKSETRGRATIPRSNGATPLDPPETGYAFPRTASGFLGASDISWPGDPPRSDGPDSITRMELMHGSTRTSSVRVAPNWWTVSFGGSSPAVSKGHCCRKNGNRSGRRIRTSHYSAGLPRASVGIRYALSDAQQESVLQLDDVLDAASPRRGNRDSG